VARTGTRSSFVKIVISRPSPGSKYRVALRRVVELGRSKTNGIPGVPSQKSIDVCRSKRDEGSVVERPGSGASASASLLALDRL
jgi:hypothetical protein